MMAIVEGQKVKVKWGKNNKRNLTEKGYIFTNYGDEIEVNPLHLSKGSDVIINVICDYCGKQKKISNVSYNKNIKNLNKYACDECGGKKIAELHEVKNKGVKFLKTTLKREKLGMVYQLTDDRILLTEKQIKLIDHIIYFCETESRFPTEKDMTNKNGYVSRTQYYKQFNTKRFVDIYKFIYPLKLNTKIPEIRKIQKTINFPNEHKCSKCEIVKPFNQDYFRGNKLNKYGLSTVCIDCENKENLIREYKKRGIVFKNREDISPEQWWEFVYNGKICFLPEFCLSKENMIKILRYVIIYKINLRNKNEICNGFIASNEFLRKYKIHRLYMMFSGKLELLQTCFPELEITEVDMPITNYTDETTLKIIEDWMIEENITIEDILANGITKKFNERMYNLNAVKFKFSKIDLFLWYFDQKQIKHPKYADTILDIDFTRHKGMFWDDSDKRIRKIRRYCEGRGIKSVIDSTELLKQWVYMNFTQEMFVSNAFEYHKYYSSLYETLIVAYPEIKDNKILFEWEWHQSNNSTNSFLLKAFRELVLYRLSDIIKDLKYDIPKYISIQFMDIIYPRFNKHIWRNRFENYYDWACQSFPEYKDFWSKEDFGLITTNDGALVNSQHEKIIYEFVKDTINLQIKAIGLKKKGKYIFRSNNEKDTIYCPDFVVERKNERPIIIEYYGWYSETNKHKTFVKYKEKTHRKNNFYKSLSEIDFIDLYPEDLRNNFEGVKNKFAIYAQKV